MDLVYAIKEIETQMRKERYEHEARIKDMSDGLAFLRKNNTCCENCFGKGRVLRKRACAEDDRPDENDPNDWIICPECVGTKLSRFEGNGTK